MSALKRQTNKEVDQLKAELEQTKRTNLDVIEKVCVSFAFYYNAIFNFGEIKCRA